MDLKELLNSVRDGKLPVDEAVKMLRLQAVKEVEDACLDVSRELRKGVPEIIFAEGKSIEELSRISMAFLEEEGRVIITRISEPQVTALGKMLKGKAKITRNMKAGSMVLKTKSKAELLKHGKVAIITAGTADVMVAEEARTVLAEMGCHVLTFYDIGIAGIHRLFPAIKRCLEEDVDCIIVVAGMEGALPSVVSALVSMPVIGVPSSSGYGAGGKGEGALISMLQSCSPGLVVVNIDNGVGAAVAAALISKRVEAKK
ncbi:MAG: nickel pincer cofactor biosynthesis protein LarB [Candidatus Methanomethylicaceae archaeon]